MAQATSKPSVLSTSTQARAEIAQNQLVLIGKEAELLNKEQTLDVLKEQVRSVV